MAVKGPNDPTAVRPSQNTRAVQLVVRRVAGKYVARCPLCGYETDRHTAAGIAQGELAVHLVMGCNQEYADKIEAEMQAVIGAALDRTTCDMCIGKGVDPSWDGNGRPCPSCKGSGKA